MHKTGGFLHIQRILKRDTKRARRDKKCAPQQGFRQQNRGIAEDNTFGDCVLAGLFQRGIGRGNYGRRETRELVKAGLEILARDSAGQLAVREAGQNVAIDRRAPAIKRRVALDLRLFNHGEPLDDHIDKRLILHLNAVDVLIQYVLFLLLELPAGLRADVNGLVNAGNSDLRAIPLIGLFRHLFPLGHTLNPP